jgi:hypothetical protein
MDERRDEGVNGLSRNIRRNVRRNVRVLRRAVWTPSPQESEPDISFTAPRFRRRLSLISRMTIRVLHGLPLDGAAGLYFVSFRGEVNRQFSINKTLITETGELSPAAFSLSVFNTPPALACMALGLTAPYSAVYPPENGFRYAVMGAVASTEAAARQGKPARLALVYADEEPLPEYRALADGTLPALAFAALLSAEEAAGDAGAALPEEAAWENPRLFLSALERAFPRGEGA